MCMYVFMYIWIQFFSLLTQDSHVFLNTVCLKKYVYVCMYVGFTGGMVLVSHDMRLISQVQYICKQLLIFDPITYLLLVLGRQGNLAMR